MHLRRLLSSLIIVPLLLACIVWENGEWCAALLCFGLFVGAHAEIHALFQAPLLLSIRLWQYLFALAFFWATASQSPAYIAAHSLLFLFGSGTIAMRIHLRGIRPLLSSTYLSFGYAMVPLACLIYLRVLPNGSSFLFFSLAVSCMSDVGGYYGGKLMGRNKMTPVISPNKTWEGTVSGVMLSIFFVTGAGWAMEMHSGKMFWLESGQTLHLIILTVIISVVGQLGDLFESALKRDAGVKDSGVTYSGHGGFLDIIDSALWIGPAMVFYVLQYQG